MEEIRLQKFLSMAGVTSRRKAEEYIEQGKVTINGELAHLGDKIIPDKDIVIFEGKEIKIENEEHIYILLNKPTGYVTTLEDEFGRDKITDLIQIEKRIIPVGRLDMYTSGAIILTDDGDFVYRITHPKHEIDKTYIAIIEGEIVEAELQQLRDGVRIEADFVTSKAQVERLEYNEDTDRTKVEVVIHEGKNKQVRRMFESLGKEVRRLHRSKIGSLGVDNLKLGEWRFLTKEEIEAF